LDEFPDKHHRLDIVMKINLLSFSEADAVGAILDFPSWFDLENPLAISILLTRCQYR
jgi:hypothetical protein